MTWMMGNNRDLLIYRIDFVIFILISILLPVAAGNIRGFLVNGAPGTIRTSDPQIRSLMLYPAELRVPATSRQKLPLRPGERGAELSARDWSAQGQKRAFPGCFDAQHASGSGMTPPILAKPVRAASLPRLCSLFGGLSGARRFGKRAAARCNDGKRAYSRPRSVPNLLGVELAARPMARLFVG